MATAEEVIKLAESEVGYAEKKSNADLDNKTGNVGTANYTKYWRDLAPGMQGQPWCQCFLNWIFMKAFDDKKAKELLHQEKGWSFYTPTAASYFQNNQQWYTTSPQKGDVIYFRNTQRICHVGIVTDIDANYVYTIEGNTSGKSGVIPNGGGVFTKKYKLSNANIAGYGRPKYDAISIKNNKLVKGIDVSKYNNITSYINLKAAGVQFGIIKIIDKKGNIEPSYTKHLNGFRNAGIPILGVYNYLYSTTVADAEKMANSVIKALGNYDYPVALDIEDPTLTDLGETLVDIIIAYRRIIEKSGRSFILYTGMSFYNTYLKKYEARLNNPQIWIARYPQTGVMNIKEDPDPNKKPQIPNVIMWQYSSTVCIPEACSGKLDCNILYGQEAPKKTTQVSSRNLPIAVGYVTANSLRVRNAPNKDGKVVGYLISNQKVLIYSIDPTTGWYKIHPSEEQYASNNYIEIQK